MRAGAPARSRTRGTRRVTETKECAVTSEQMVQDEPLPVRQDRRIKVSQNPGCLEVWSRSAPIRLAGYEDDLAEPHILPSVD